MTTLPVPTQIQVSALSSESPLQTILGIPTTLSSPSATDTSNATFSSSSLSSINTTSSAVVPVTFLPPVVTSSAVQSSGDQKGSTEASSGSHHSHLSIIISSTTLGLVVILILLLIFWFCVTHWRRRNQTKQHEVDATDKENGASVEETSDNGHMGGDNNNEPTPTITGDRTGSTGRIEEEFNSMNMVAPTAVLTAMTLSMTESPSTATSNPPPPYGNMIQTGNEVQGPAVAHRTILMNRSSSFHGVQVSVERPSRAISRTTSGTGSLVEGETGVVGVANSVRLFPSAATVQYTYIPSSPDELNIKSGDLLKISGVFDDGWCLCATEEGRRGVVPMACLDVFQTPTVETSDRETESGGEGEEEVTGASEGGENQEGRDGGTPGAVSQGEMVAQENLRERRSSAPQRSRFI